MGETEGRYDEPNVVVDVGLCHKVTGAGIELCGLDEDILERERREHLCTGWPGSDGIKH